MTIKRVELIADERNGGWVFIRDEDSELVLGTGGSRRALDLAYGPGAADRFIANALAVLGVEATVTWR